MESQLKMASPEEMLNYENNCINSYPIEKTVTLEIKSIMALLGLADELRAGMERAKIDFTESVKWHRSGDAEGAAGAYRLQSELLEQLRKIHLDFAGPDSAWAF